MKNINQVVFPLYCARKDASVNGMGTASIIGAWGRYALFVTARHVFKDHIEAAGKPLPPYPPFHGEFAVLGSEAGRSYIADVVGQVVYSHSTDIAFGLLQAREGSPFNKALAIDLAPPVVDTPIITFEFSAMQPSVLECDYEAEKFRMFASRGLGAYFGKVIPDSKSSLVQWPSFRIDNPIHSGMSGGPVVELFNGDTPVIRGILASDMTTTRENNVGDGSVAAVSEIWPVGEMDIGVLWGGLPELGLSSARTLIDLIALGHVSNR